MCASGLAIKPSGPSAGWCPRTMISTQSTSPAPSCWPGGQQSQEPQAAALPRPRNSNRGRERRSLRSQNPPGQRSRQTTTRSGCPAFGRASSFAPREASARRVNPRAAQPQGRTHSPRPAVWLRPAPAARRSGSKLPPRHPRSHRVRAAPAPAPGLRHAQKQTLFARAAHTAFNPKSNSNPKSKSSLPASGHDRPVARPVKGHAGLWPRGCAAPLSVRAKAGPVAPPTGQASNSKASPKGATSNANTRTVSGSHGANHPHRHNHIPRHGQGKQHRPRTYAHRPSASRTGQHHAGRTGSHGPRPAMRNLARLSPGRPALTRGPFLRRNKILNCDITLGNAGQNKGGQCATGRGVRAHGWGTDASG